MPDQVVHFVFGNHKHWTGMVWEWGEDTLVNSTWALRRVIDETGLKAGLNFDGRGIEQLAVVAPECIAWIKEAIAEGRIELWGGTYTQPYGSLIGSESNIRQRVAGIRACERILGVRPKIFAEEEFDFFSQLPQLLVQFGYEGALLFPQHTWHTPTIPAEDDAVIEWEGIDGSRIRTIPFSERCLMRGLPTAVNRLGHPLVKEADEPLMITWLEVLDKPNWMWRTEFVIPYLTELQRQPGVRIVPTVVGEYLHQHERVPARPVRYMPEDVFHGISAGKNGDALPRLWHRAERTLTRAENLAAWCSLLGQPYPQFDSYPEWQLEEAWRHLMMSQGHDAYECEGFTNRVGHRYAQMAIMLGKDVCDRCESALRRNGHLPESEAACHEWARFDENGELWTKAPFDMRFGMPSGWKRSGDIRSAGTSEGRFVTTPIESEYGSGTLKWAMGESLRLQLNLFLTQPLPPGVLGSVRIPLRIGREVSRYHVGTPFCVETIAPHGEWLHRYPQGHWLTSAQAEELIPSPICFSEFVCVEAEPTNAVLIACAGTSLALAHPEGLDLIVFGRDSWDQDNWARQATVDLAIAFCDLSDGIGGLFPAARAAMTGSASLLVGAGPVVSVSRGAMVTAVRKVGEELEVRFFETDLEARDVELEFRWEVESARRVSPLGEDLPCEEAIAGNTVKARVRAGEIVTLRVLFRGVRTEYLPIDDHRSVWVGDFAK